MTSCNLFISPFRSVHWWVVNHRWVIYRCSYLNKATPVLHILSHSFKRSVNLGDETSISVRHNHVVITLTWNHHGIHLEPQTDAPLFEGSVICLCAHSGLLVLISHSAQPVGSVLITGVQLELAFQFFDAAAVEIARCQFQPPPILLSPLLVCLMHSPQCASALQCSAREKVREWERKNTALLLPVMLYLQGHAAQMQFI